MEPLSLIFSAIVAGATAALKQSADEEIIETYKSLKAFVESKWSHVEVELLERNPASKARQAVLFEDLQKIEDLEDHEALARATAVLSAVEVYDEPNVARSAAATVEAGASVSSEGLVEQDSMGARSYMIGRGPALYSGLIERPHGPWNPEVLGVETIADLRGKLLFGRKRPPKPQPITVTGTLFPCALLSSGWWDKHKDKHTGDPQWRDEVQKWLFHGFDEWGPSWDFTWDFEHPERSKSRQYFIAQLGEGDEANSLPVLIPREKARGLQEHVAECGGWGGIDAEVTGILGHRRHFEKYIGPHERELFGGFLDYCLWIDASHPKQGVEPIRQPTSIYSGYLWRCVVPEAWVKSDTLELRDVYFVWEHTNFASKDAVAYGLDAIERKEEYLRSKFGKLILVQKSSSLVPGTSAWPQHEIYSMLFGKAGPTI